MLEVKVGILGISNPMVLHSISFLYVLVGNLNLDKLHNLLHGDLICIITVSEHT